MKKSFSPTKFNWLVLVLLFGLSGLQAFSQATQPFSTNESPLPAPTEPVNDFAGVLDENTKQTLNQRIKDFKAKTNPQVVLAVAIVKTTGERPIFDYSLAVSRGWKIGTKEDDNPSALLFIAIDDRKYFTQVSRNLEDELTDGIVGQLQRQYLVPAFKQGNYSKGVNDTIEAYIRTIEARGGGGGQQPANTANTQTEQRPQKSSGGGCSIMTCLIILFVLMLIIFSRGSSNRNRKDRNRWGGGGGFGGGGSALPWIIGGVLGGMGNDRGSSSSWGGGGGGSSSGGSDWGGFGGGGDFGGGGAGGDW
jgi:uncharacterized protein